MPANPRVHYFVQWNVHLQVHGTRSLVLWQWNYGAQRNQNRFSALLKLCMNSGEEISIRHYDCGLCPDCLITMLLLPHLSHARDYAGT